MPAQTQRANAIKAFLSLERDGIDAGGEVANSDRSAESDNRLVEKKQKDQLRTELNDYGWSRSAQGGKCRRPDPSAGESKLIQAPPHLTRLRQR